MKNALVTIVAFSLIVLLIGFAFVPMISSTDKSDATTELSQGDTVTIGDTINLTAVEVDGTNDTATLEYVDIEGTDSFQATYDLNVEETQTLSGENITTNTTQIDSMATVETTYPATFGWDEGAKGIAEYLDLILVVMGFVAVVGGFVRVIQ